MLRSMTAFASQEANNEWGALSCELRSVNHRYLESFIRLPEPLRAFEPGVRERIQKRLDRGKIECFVRFKPAVINPNILTLNDALIRTVLATIQRIEVQLERSAPVSALEVLAWPGVTVETELDRAPLEQALMSLMDAALDDLLATRAREGAQIVTLIEARLSTMQDLIHVVRARRPAVLAALRQKILARIAELNLEPDTSRLEQELALVAQRLDVAEELDRLEAHVRETGAVLTRDEPVGRRLDFLMQELNREANTLSAKSADTETTRAAVELKVLIEQMREQVQNIE